MEAIAGLCTHPSRGRASGGRAKGREGPESPGRGTSALGAHPWEVVSFLPLFSSGHLRFRG